MPVVVSVEVSSQRQRTNDESQPSDLTNHIVSFDGLAKKRKRADLKETCRKYFDSAIRDCQCTLHAA